jgi:hypothetical protein
VADAKARANRKPAATPSPLGASGYSFHAIHLLRTVQNNNLTLSQMADQKASILMGATFVVFSIAVGRSFGGHIPWSLAILAVFAFLSALSAVLAVLPSVGRPKLGSAEANPLFFGHFAYREEAEWTDAVIAELEADETVFRTMLHDIYQNGLVLQRRKYRWLGYAYRIFVLGLVVTLAAFALEMAARF